MKIRRIRVLSDTHMGEYHVGGGSKKYPDKNTNELINFLDDCLITKIDTLVLLGDIIDLWNFKMNESPCSASEVVSNDENIKKVVEKICSVGKKIKIIYVSGNHDDRMSKKDIDEIFGQNTIVFCDALRIQNLWMEHGHRFDLFCQPVRKNRYIEDYTLGYFADRHFITYSTKSQEEVVESMAKKFKELAKILFDPSKVDVLFQLIFEGCKPTDYFVLKEGKKIEVKEVREKYKFNVINKMKRIPEKIVKEAIISQFLTAFGNMGEVFKFESNQPPEDIQMIICGHAHYLTCMSREYERKNSSPFVYLNSGTWNKGNFVDIEYFLESEKKVCVVKLMDWNKNSVLYKKEFRNTKNNGINHEDLFFNYRLIELDDKKSTSCTGIDFEKMLY